MKAALLTIAGGYLGMGVLTFVLFWVLIGWPGLQFGIFLLLGWPIMWAMGVIFALAALAAPH